jgi:hypothetical protein
VDYETVAYLRSASPAWRLLRADSSPLALSVLGQIFVVDNVRTIGETDLVSRVDDLLYAANAIAPSVDGACAYPRSARDYVDTWADPKQGWLRKFYPDGSAEAHYDATVDVEKAYAFVTGLRNRAFIGTESRLQTIVELLRVIVAGAEGDAGAQLEQLRRRREEIDAEIVKVVAGETGPMDPVAVLDRYQHFATTARELLADFRAVEDNFRDLDRTIRADIASWEGSKGDLLDRIVGDRHAIADSDQGRSFQAFHDFLLSRVRRDEMTNLLGRLVELEGLEVDRSLGRIHFDWLDAAERTQQTVRLLSEQLRRFLDDKVWLENRRVVELLRSIERSALALRDMPAPDVVMTIDASSPEVQLPFERPLYAPPAFTGVDSDVRPGAEEALDLGSLFDQVFVDTARLTAAVRSVLRHQDQVSLDALLHDHPAEQGIAELVAYLSLAEDDFDVVIDDRESREIVLADADGRMRAVRLPQVLLVRRRASIPTAVAP